MGDQGPLMRLSSFLRVSQGGQISLTVSVGYSPTICWGE